VLSGAATPLMMRQVLAKGAAGFLTKTGRSDELLSALSRVLEGEVLASPDLLMADGQIDPPLTPRQEDVLQLLLQGYETKDICDKLFIAEQTAKSHVSAIIKAFGVKTRLQVIVAAARYGYGKGARPA
jgi:DNA-binding NarL/FixJ family response regulator